MLPSSNKKPKKSRQSKKNNSDSENSDAFNFSNISNDRFVIALILIAPAFIVIAAVLVLQFVLIQDSSDDIIQVAVQNPNLDFNATKFLVEKLEENNNRNNEQYETLINILVPVFAAWISAVVAFYFGSKQAEDANKNLRSMTEQMQKGGKGTLDNSTVEDLIEQYPECKEEKDVTTASLNEIINSDFEKKIQDYGYVRIIYEKPRFSQENYSNDFIDKKLDANGKLLSKDKIKFDRSFIEKQKARDSQAGLEVPDSEYDPTNPSNRVLWEIIIHEELDMLDSDPQYYDPYVGKTLGILYLGDFYDNSIENFDNYVSEGKHTLAQLILEGKPYDTVTDRQWTINPNSSVENFSEVYLTETLREAKSRMEDIGTNSDLVKAVVLDEEDNARAIVTFYKILSLL